MDIPLDRPAAVRKMKVLGPRQAVELQTIDTQRKQAKAMRDYNPTINAMAEAQAQMGSIINTAEQSAAAEPTVAGKRKRKTAPRPTMAASSSLALYNACLERLRALKSQFDHTYDPLLQLLVQNAAVAPVAPQPAVPVVGPVVAQPVGAAAPGNVVPAAAGSPPLAGAAPLAGETK